KLQEEIIARIELRYGVGEQTPGAPDSRRSASGNNRPQSVPGKGVHPDPRVSIGQTYPVDMARMKLDAPNETMRKTGSPALAGDMAQKKLDAQNLELKKEIAYALAPTTMKCSTFNEDGLVVAEASHSSQEAREGEAPTTHPSQKTREGEAPTTHPSQKT